ncbi:hypothetical protein Q7P37_010507 [Cladosporium fusiforme]
MKTFTAFFAALAAGTAFAAPTAHQSRKPTSVNHLVKFDNVPAGLIDGAPVRGLNPLGSHEGLYYSNMGVISATPLLAGLNPQSRPNVLGYDVVASLQGQHELRTDYDDSTTSHFDLRSFYFGCVVSTQETLASLPLSCSIDITGYRNGKKVASQTARFRKPLLQLTADMAKVELNGDFCDVDRVTFDTNGLIPSVLLAVLMDNLEYTTFPSK